MLSSNNRKSFFSRSYNRKAFLESRGSPILEDSLHFDNIAENRNLLDSELIQRAGLHMDLESIKKSSRQRGTTIPHVFMRDNQKTL